MQKYFSNLQVFFKLKLISIYMTYDNYTLFYNINKLSR